MIVGGCSLTQLYISIKRGNYSHFISLVTGCLRLSLCFGYGGRTPYNYYILYRCFQLVSAFDILACLT